MNGSLYLLWALVSCKDTTVSSKSSFGPPGDVVAHHLTRTQYENSVRDLVGVTTDLAEFFPPDDPVAGFDNIASNLTTSPLHVEMYELAANTIATELLRPARYEPYLWQFTASEMSNPPEGSIVEPDGLLFYSDGQWRESFEVVEDGVYTLSTTAWGEQAGDEPVTLVLSFDGRFAAPRQVIATTFSSRQTLTSETYLSKGTHTVDVAFTNDYFNPDTLEDRNLWVHSMSVVGPKDAPLKENPLREAFVTCEPSSGRECIDSLLFELANRAYRRPLFVEQQQRLSTLLTSLESLGLSEEELLHAGVQSIFLSASFLFRTEPISGDGPQLLDDYSLASRLSYFLWSSTPDQQLLSAAEKGKLQTTSGIEGEVRRMLLDAKAQALVSTFAGQWLYLRGISAPKVNEELFPTFNSTVQSSMEEEAHRFVHHFLLDDVDLKTMLTTTQREIDPVLATLYGVPFAGSEWDTADLQDHHRTGLLTLSGLLTTTSYPSRTSPVLRGKFIMSQLLCDEPEPPPAGVEGLSEDVSAGSLRERLEQHRADPACASCHVVMDQLGFALDNYDAIGRYRTTDIASNPIDASGELPDGRAFVGPDQLAQMLFDDEEVERCITQQTLTFALGRALIEDDTPTINTINRSFVGRGRRFSDLAVAIATSDAFRMQEVSD